MEYTPPPLFKQGPSARVRLMAFVTLSVLLLFLDARYGAMEVVRKGMGTVLYPLQRLASLPVELSEAGMDYLTTLDSLKADNEQLKRDRLFNHQRLHELETLKAENQKLRKLMGVGSVLQVKRTLLTEVVSDASDPFSKKIVLNKGLIQGVKEGMPVIDELGLVGQVTRAFPSRAEVSLITDKEQIVPVESLRNGLRSVAYGGAEGGILELRFLAPNANIEKGDLLVTSGLDGVYPRGIPVARVNSVERNARYAFASVYCQPIAGVESHRFMLVLDTEKTPETVDSNSKAPETGNTRVNPPPPASHSPTHVPSKPAEVKNGP
ncbi:rod shape-determining protein MreC [Limnobacter humi]|uniref:Cell shape-determining protein MreC n=1 Tax=Limnobacter humi TaxID=1778671 RepID=A0ABT1WG66_9BURK|nr:rod shape-determining protein MreC [Limnobacter humi]MCQ8895404.1 rod shape-determining protein MreC [Limnobacter humi]